MNISAPTKIQCSGCCACYAVCPKKAIEIKVNTIGFLQPIVNDSSCIDCGLCYNSCIRYNDRYFPLTNGKLYSCKSNDEFLIGNATTAGVATEMAKYALANGYYVVGVVYDYKQDFAKTIITNDYAKLGEIKGSKYLQSNASQAFRDLITIAKKDIEKKFFVFGTPCQIAGLRRVITLLKLKNQFVLVDLFCHGVPSYLVWNNYLEDIKEKIGSISNINFRSKEEGWHNYFIRITGSKGNYVKYKAYDPFFQAFFDNVFLNESCLRCSWRQKYTASDIRLGDFWGDKYKKDNKGVNALITYSNIGEKVYKELLESNYITELSANIDINECLAFQVHGNYDTEKYRDMAFNSLLDSNSKNKLSRSIALYRSYFPLKDKIRFFILAIEKKLPYLRTLRQILK